MRSTWDLAGGMRGSLRAIVLTAIGLAIATPLLVRSAPASEQQSRSDPLVARVNRHEIHLSDVYKSIESLSLGDQIDVRSDMDVYIEAMVNEEVLFQWAFRNDFKGEPDLRQEIKDLVVRQLIEKYVRSKINVDEGEVRAYYENNPTTIRMEHVIVRRILLLERGQCEQLMARIDSHDTFAEMAKVHSLDKETASLGGLTGLTMRLDGVTQGPELEFFDMKVGEMRVFDVPEGCLLVRSVFFERPPVPPFNEVKDRIKSFLASRQELQLIDQLFEEATQNMQVERFYSEQ